MKESNKLPKLIVVGGPTGAGKTALGIELAKKYNGAIISADSRQVYKYLDVGTNKGDLDYGGKYEYFVKNHSSEEVKTTEFYMIEEIPIYLVSFLDIKEKYSVFDFKNDALGIIYSLIRKNITPILVGGTGLYIDSIINNYTFSNSRNEYKIDTKYDDLSAMQLLEKLPAKIVSELNESERGNKRRLLNLVNKISSDKNNGNVRISVDYLQKNTGEKLFDVDFYYPKYEWNDLKNILKARVLDMLDQGLENEVRSVLQMGYSETDAGLKVMGYSQMIQYIKGEINREFMIESITRQHIQYARRQRTWFEGKGRGYGLKYV